MATTLQHISIRHKAIYVPEHIITCQSANRPDAATLGLAANAAKLGFGFSKQLLQTLTQTTPAFKLEVYNILQEVTGIHKNWTPLVKGWDTPTREGIADHVITWFVNQFNFNKGKKLPCGHYIPEGTFPLERYNGCPFCGTPFNFEELKLRAQGSKLTILELWTDTDLQVYLTDLLLSKTPLDGTQVDNLFVLLANYQLPKDVTITMKETLIVVIDALVEAGKTTEAGNLITGPNDVFRFLWYVNTGYLQLVKPKTIINRNVLNTRNAFVPEVKEEVIREMTAKLKLKYTRPQCKMVATWLNNVSMDAEKACEQMHPRRAMWVRFIRALRLAEYAKKTGFENLRLILDVFYNQVYEVTQGTINNYKLKLDAANTFKLLQERPGLFARSLFANMLWFGDDVTLRYFEAIANKVPARLLVTLCMYAHHYFDATKNRIVTPLGGVHKTIPANKLLKLYTRAQLKAMVTKIEQLTLTEMQRRFGKEPNGNQTMYIAEELYLVPLTIGDRSDTIQDLPAVVPGTRFKVEGDTVRLFMQWGTGLPAQHLDMDLSCMVLYPKRKNHCSYSNLNIPGCKHSGDIQQIPEKKGTAEYIDISVAELQNNGAEYVAFTCNAFTYGSLSPNMVVGWMNSKYPMHISETSGVAYDPSCVQHQVRITQSLTKGLTFGVLDVKQREIIWLEMEYHGQTVKGMNTMGIQTLLDRFNSKFTIGNLLALKAEAQGLTLVDNANEADEVYTYSMANNPAAVTQLLID